MNEFIIYRVSDGQIMCQMATQYLSAQDIPNGCWVMPGWANIRTQKVDVVDPEDPSTHTIIDIEAP